MKKSLQVLSAILVASFALANVVSAEITVAGEKQDTTFEKLLESVEHKTVNTKAYYESLIDDAAAKKASEELTAAFGLFKDDVEKVSKYSVALCQAKKELIEADKEIKNAALYTQLNTKFIRVNSENTTIGSKTLDAEPVDTKKLDNKKMNFLLKQDVEALNALDAKYQKWNDDKAPAEETIKNPADILGNKTYNSNEDKYIAELKEALNKQYGDGNVTINLDKNGFVSEIKVKKAGMLQSINNEINEYLTPNHDNYNRIMAYQESLIKAYAYRGDVKKGVFTTPYEQTVAELRQTAAKAAAKVKLIKELGKRLNITFVPCEFEDPFETAAEAKQAETKKAEEKKDSVPNTAAFNFFPQLPTTCSYAIVSEGEGCCKVFKVVKACDLKKGEKTVAMTYAQLAEYSIPALACSCK